MLRPPPQLTVSEWAERHRMLGSRASAEPGPWRTSRTPYLKEVMDALSAVHPARRVVFMKGAQVGATESGNNWLGYIMHHVPAPALAVQPTVELAKRFSRQRIDPLLEETPALRERVAPARARDSGNTMLSKEFPGGILVLAATPPRCMAICVGCGILVSRRPRASMAGTGRSRCTARPGWMRWSTARSCGGV